MPLHPENKGVSSTSDLVHKPTEVDSHSLPEVLSGRAGAGCELAVPQLQAQFPAADRAQEGTNWPKFNRQRTGRPALTQDLPTRALASIQ